MLFAFKTVCVWNDSYQGSVDAVTICQVVGALWLRVACGFACFQDEADTVACGWMFSKYLLVCVLQVHNLPMLVWRALQMGFHRRGKGIAP